MKVVHWHLDSNTIMPRAFYIFVWESMYACEMLITKKVSPWSKASEHPTTVQVPYDKSCFVSRLWFLPAFKKISWELICAGLTVRYQVSEGNAENAENIVLEVVCAQTGGKNPKACAEKFLFIQTTRPLFKLRQVYPTYWKKPPVNRPIFLRAKTHPSSVATSPELIKSVMAMAKLSMLVARRVKLMILVTH